MQPTLPPTQSVQSMQGRVFELATDYAGSRVIQQLVDAASPSTLRSLLREVQLQVKALTKVTEKFFRDWEFAHRRV